MKITGGTIDWSASHSGALWILITCEDEPDGYVYEARRVSGDTLSAEQVGVVGGSMASQGTIYYAERDGFVRYFFEDPNDQHGFGGSVFNIVMTDGTKRAVKGPWSSNPGSVRAAGFPAVIDVASNHCARSVLVSALEQQFDKITVPPFDPTTGWGSCIGAGWYEQNGPRVDFPPGSVCCLVVGTYGSHEPAVRLPDGTVWRKPTEDQRTPARHAEIAMLGRAKLYIGAGTEPVERERTPSFDGEDDGYDEDDDTDDEDRPVTF